MMVSVTRWGLVAACLICSNAVGQRSFDEWWTAVAECGAAGPPIDGVAIKYTVDDLFVPDQATLNAMRAGIAGHPEHPDRARLARYERLLAGERYTRANTVWRHHGQWRWNHEDPAQPGSFVDLAWGDGIAWRLDAASLSVVDQAGTSAAGMPIQNGSSSTSADLCTLLTGNLAAAAAAGLALEPEVSGDRWTVRVSGRIKEGRVNAQFKADGRWFQEQGWGTIESSELRAEGAPGEAATVRLELTGWKLDPNLDLGVPDVVTEFDASRTVRRMTMLGTEPFKEAEMRKLVELPGRKKPDPVRGEPTFTTFTDLRQAGRKVQRIDPETRSATAVDLSEGRPATGALRTWGWVILVSICAALAFLWLWRRRVAGV